MRRSYPEELKAQALSRVLAGETAKSVARSLDLDSALVRKWVERNKQVVTNLVTHPTKGQQLESDLARFLHASLETLTKHAEHYGSKEWLEKQSASILLESTRTLGSRFTAIMDRLGGRTADASDTDS